MRGTMVFAAARTSIIPLALALASLTCFPAVARSATKHAAGLSQAPFAYNTSGIVGIQADPASVSGPAVLEFQGLSGASYDPATGQPISLGQFVMNPASITNGATTTYNGTPFEVEIQAPKLNKTSSIPVLDKIFPSLGKSLSLKTVNENSVLLKGTLTGTVAPNGQSNVTATVNTIKLGSFDGSSKDHITHYTFPIRFSQLKLPSSWVMAGSTVPTGSKLTMIPATTTATSTPTTTTPTQTTTTATTTTSPAVAQAQLIAATTAAPASTVLAAPSAEMGSVGTPTPTPEPTTILVFATAFGGLALARRRARTTAR